MSEFITDKSIADRLNKILLSLQWIYKRVITTEDVKFEYKNNSVTFIVRDATTRFEVLAQTCMLFALINYAHKYYKFSIRNVTVRDEDETDAGLTFSLSYKTDEYELPDQADFRARTITNSIFMPASKYLGEVAEDENTYLAEVNVFVRYCYELFRVAERVDFPPEIAEKLKSICNLLAIDMKSIAKELRGDLQMFIYAE